MSLHLKLQLNTDKKVSVTNSETSEQLEVTFGFLQEQTGDSLLLLIQYKYYELYYNAERSWERIKGFNSEREAIREIYIDQKFRDIMVNDSWLKITEYDQEMYYKALVWANSFTPKTRVDRTAFVAAGSGAVAGAAASNLIGGIGVAVGGTAIGVGTLSLATLGAVAGLAVYGIGKALD